MSSVLVDTHILVWWRSERGRLSREQARVLSNLERTGAPLAVSAITLWELAKLEAGGRIRVNISIDKWLEEVEEHPLIEVYPLTAKVVATSTRLGADFHRDPADQIIVATAQVYGLPLLTADERIRRWGKVAVV